MAFYFALFNMSSVNMEDARKKSQNYRKHKSRSCSPNANGTESQKVSATVDSPSIRVATRKEGQKGRKSRLQTRKSSDVTFEPLFKYGEELEKRLEQKGPRQSASTTTATVNRAELGSISSGDSINSAISPYLSGSQSTISRTKAVDNYRKLPKPRVIDIHSKLTAPGPSGVKSAVGANSFYPRTRLTDIDECGGDKDKERKPSDDTQSLSNSTVTTATVEDNLLNTKQHYPIQKKVSFESPRLSVFKLEQNLQANFLAKSLQKSTVDHTDGVFMARKSSADLLDVVCDKKGAKNGPPLLPTTTRQTQSAAAKSTGSSTVPSGLAKLRRVIKKIIEEQRNKKLLQALLDVGEGGKNPAGNLLSAIRSPNLPEPNQTAKVSEPPGTAATCASASNQVDIDTTALENEQNRLREKRFSGGFLGRNRLSTLRNSFRAELQLNSVAKVRRNLSDHNLQGIYTGVTAATKPVVMRKKRFSMLTGHSNKSNRHSAAAGCETETQPRVTPIVRRRSTTDKNSTAYRIVRNFQQQMISGDVAHRSTSSLVSSSVTGGRILTNSGSVNDAYQNSQGSPKRPLPYTDSYCYRFNRCYEQHLAQPTPTQRIIPVSSTTVRTKIRRGRNSFQGWDNLAFNPSPDHRRIGQSSKHSSGKLEKKIGDSRQRNNSSLHPCSSESFINTDEPDNCVLTKYRSLNSDFNAWL